MENRDEHLMLSAVSCTVNLRACNSHLLSLEHSEATPNITQLNLTVFKPDAAYLAAATILGVA